MEFGINEWIENTSETNRNQHKNLSRNKLSHELSKSVNWRKVKKRINRPMMKRRSSKRKEKKTKIKSNSVGTFFHTLAQCKIDRCRKMYGAQKISNLFSTAIGLCATRQRNHLSCDRLFLSLAVDFVTSVSTSISESLLHRVNKHKKAATDERWDFYLGRKFSFFLILDRFRLNRHSHSKSLVFVLVMLDRTRERKSKKHHFVLREWKLLSSKPNKPIELSVAKCKSSYLQTAIFILCSQMLTTRLLFTFLTVNGPGVVRVIRENTSFMWRPLIFILVYSFCVYIFFG